VIVDSFRICAPRGSTLTRLVASSWTLCGLMGCLAWADTPPAAASETPPATATSATASPEALPKFTVNEYRVIGNTVLSSREIETVLYPLLGADKTFPDVEAARAALEAAYHNRGFGTVFVDIVPGNDLAEGLVRLRVTEGKVNAATISGAKYFSEKQILEQIPAAAPGSVLRIPDLQRQLADVNTQSADRSVVPILRAGPIPGTVDVAFKVDDHLPLHGSVEINNQATPDTDALRLNASLQYTNLFADLDAISLQYQDTPEKFGEAAVFAINYASRPLFTTWRPSAYFIDSNSNVTTIGTLGVVGKGQISGLRLSDILEADSAANQAIVLGVDYKHFRQTIDLAAAAALDTPITYVNVSIAYSGSWHENSLFETLNLAANFGPRGLARINGADEFENDRFESRANYFYVRGDGSLSWGAPLHWRLTVRAAGQYTREPLVTNEDYSLAGVDGVRGYLEAEVLADTAVKGTVQLQSPTWRLKERSLVDGFVFFDDAHGSMLDPLPGEPTHFDLRSTGAGLDLLPGGSYTSSVVWALPLVDGTRTRRYDSRVLFLIRGSF